MIFLCQIFLFVSWLIAAVAGIIRAAEKSAPQDRVIGFFISLIIDAAYLYAFVRTGAFNGFLFF